MRKVLDILAWGMILCSLGLTDIPGLMMSILMMTGIQGMIDIRKIIGVLEMIGLLN